MAIIGGNDMFCEVTINQNNSRVEIKKLMGNYIISFNGRSINSYVVIPGFEAVRLLAMAEDIMKKIKSMEEGKENNRTPINSEIKQTKLNEEMNYNCSEDVV